MKKTILLTLLLALSMVAFAQVCAISVDCPVHDGARGYATGAQTYDAGHRWAEYKCPYNHGHTFWVRCD